MTITADQLRERINAVIHGHLHADVIDALGSLLEQAAADMSDTVEDACALIDEFAAALKKDVAENWHHVVARRAKG